MADTIKEFYRYMKSDLDDEDSAATAQEALPRWHLAYKHTKSDLHDKDPATHSEIHESFALHDPDLQRIDTALRERNTGLIEKEFAKMITHSDFDEFLRINKDTLGLEGDALAAV